MKRIETLIVQPGITVKQAWRQLSDNGYRVLFVADTENRLLGSLTDGDVRRWLLDDKSLLVPIETVMQKNPTVALDTDDNDAIQKKLVTMRIECIPVVNADRVIQRVCFWDEFFKESHSSETTEQVTDVPVVVMAGGRGERLKPFTNIIPKPLIPIGEKPVIEVIMDRFARYGVGDFHLMLNYKAGMICSYFKDHEAAYNLHYYKEEMPCGTIGALTMLKDTITTTCVVSNADIMVDANFADIVQFHKEKQNKITLVCSMKHFGIPYGVVEIANGGELTGIREKPEYDYLVLTGVYVLEPELMQMIPENTKYDVTDLIEKLRVEGQKIGVYPIAEKAWMDVGELPAYRDTLKRMQAFDT